MGTFRKLPKILNEIEIVTGDIRDNDLMDKYIKNCLDGISFSSSYRNTIFFYSP